MACFTVQAVMAVKTRLMHISVSLLVKANLLTPSRSRMKENVCVSQFQSECLTQNLGVLTLRTEHFTASSRTAVPTVRLAFTSQRSILISLSLIHTINCGMGHCVPDKILL